MGITEFLKDIISIPSLSGEESQVAARVSEEFRNLDYDEVIESKGNICGRIGNGKKVILFDAHMDVVEPGKGWDQDPFSAVIENEYIIGRGSCDDKGSLASCIYGLSGRKTDKLTVYMLASVREEVAEGNGIREFFEDTKIKPDFIVICEPSSLRLAKGNRGRLGVRIDIKGKSGHASDPNAGNNAIYNSIDVLRNIQSLNERLTNDSVVVTKVSTPNKNINIIPESCSIYCDYRSGTGREESEIIELIKDCIDKTDAEIVKITPYYIPWEISEDHILMKAGLESMKEVSGVTEVTSWDFCTNGSYTAGELGIPTIGFGPGTENEAHTSGEKIKIEDLKKAEKFYFSLTVTLEKYI